MQHLSRPTPGVSMRTATPDYPNIADGFNRQCRKLSHSEDRLLASPAQWFHAVTAPRPLRQRF
jgi:hypothetical protein